MTYYFTIIVFWIILFYFGKKSTTNKRLFFAILPLFLIMAMKSVSVGSDTISYFNRYINAEYMLTAEQTMTEPGFNLLCYFFHDILKMPFYVYNALISFLICFILALFLKKFSSNIFQSLFLYMTIGLFSMSMSGMRQMLAISICLIPIIIAKEDEDYRNQLHIHRLRRILIGILCVGVAYTIHNSSVVFLPILFLMDIRLTKSQSVMIMIVAISTILFKSYLIEVISYFMLERYEKYDLYEGYAMNLLALLVPIAIGLFCVVVSKPDNGKRKYSKFISQMFIFLALYVMFTIQGLNHIQISRLGFFFMNAEVILIPYALKRLPFRSRPVVTLTIFFLCLLYFYLGTNEGTLKIDNYKFFWEEPIYLSN